MRMLARALIERVFKFIITSIRFINKRNENDVRRFTSVGAQLVTDAYQTFPTFSRFAAKVCILIQLDGCA